MSSKPLLAAPNGARFGLAVPISNVVIENSAGSDATEAGLQVRERILTAVKRDGEESRVRALAACVRDFPKETLRCPEVWEFLEWLVSRRKSGAIDRILRDCPLRGRAQRSAEDVYFEVAVIEATMRREGCSARKAAAIARDEHERLRHKSAESLENDYGRGRDTYRLLNKVRFLPGSAVTDREWSRACADPSGKRGSDMSTKDDDNHANQMNPNNDAYWESRGFDDRPGDWEDRVESDEQAE